MVVRNEHYVTECLALRPGDGGTFRLCDTGYDGISGSAVTQGGKVVALLTTRVSQRNTRSRLMRIAERLAPGGQLFVGDKEMDVERAKSGVLQPPTPPTAQPPTPPTAQPPTPATAHVPEKAATRCPEATIARRKRARDENEPMHRIWEALERQGEAINRISETLERHGEAINRISETLERQGEALERQGEALLKLKHEVRVGFAAVADRFATLERRACDCVELRYIAAKLAQDGSLWERVGLTKRSAPLKAKFLTARPGGRGVVNVVFASSRATAAKGLRVHAGDSVRRLGWQDD